MVGPTTYYFSTLQDLRASETYSTAGHVELRGEYLVENDGVIFIILLNQREQTYQEKRFTNDYDIT